SRFVDGFEREETRADVDRVAALHEQLIETPGDRRGHVDELALDVALVSRRRRLAASSERQRAKDDRGAARRASRGSDHRLLRARGCAGVRPAPSTVNAWRSNCAFVRSAIPGM